MRKAGSGRNQGRTHHRSLFEAIAWAEPGISRPHLVFPRCHGAGESGGGAESNPRPVSRPSSTTPATVSGWRTRRPRSFTRPTEASAAWSATLPRNYPDEYCGLPSPGSHGGSQSADLSGRCAEKIESVAQSSDSAQGRIDILRGYRRRAGHARRQALYSRRIPRRQRAQERGRQDLQFANTLLQAEIESRARRRIRRAIRSAGSSFNRNFLDMWSIPPEVAHSHDATGSWRRCCRN